MILFLDSVLKLSSTHHIEYKIPFTTINNTQPKAAIYVKYLIIFHIISVIDQKPFLTVHSYIWVSDVFFFAISVHQAPGIFSVTVTFIPQSVDAAACTFQI